MDYSVSCGNIKEKTNTRDNMKKEITDWDRQFMWGITGKNNRLGSHRAFNASLGPWIL